MASQAALTIITDFLRGLGEVMRIVAGNAAQFLAARLKAPAGIHLLHMADRLLLVEELSGPDINGNKLVQGKARTIIRQPPILFLDAEFPLEMTLLAHSFAPHRLQVERVDDRVIDTVDIAEAFSFPNVNLS